MDQDLDWALVQIFLAVAEGGSLSAAARSLGQSQPTLGRQVKRLEDRLGLALFERHARGLELSEAGRRLLPAAREMAGAMGRMRLAAAGQDGALQGRVRITASEVVAHHLLPPLIAQMRTELPQVGIDLVPSDTTENLLFREADIALRMYRPRQLDLVAQHLGDLPVGAFAAKSYVARRGRPGSAAELKDHDLVGYDRSELMLRAMRALGLEMQSTDFALRCDSQVAYWELVRAGCGVGFMQCGVARRDPLVEELEIGVEIPPLPVWIAAHEAIRPVPRVAAVWSRLVAGLGALTG
ncbi:LysR family transcriptional regulator [Pseudooceanicola nanhaiensis]|uniref:LysR family transcriptional regulator n=1 Tax=Pseudooceanicola nanhaiensis TaxID=375761 RepID=UPI001CD481E5|nr:LysR family transcriptional regulator [Pseudooceanicola nanhaiensis]MCA0921915.1 LysR family transcriptional regulator [Pseudooceanicola nanhaiensis]